MNMRQGSLYIINLHARMYSPITKIYLNNEGDSYFQIREIRNAECESKRNGSSAEEILISYD